MKISRRNFLKTAAYSAGASAVPLSLSLPASAMDEGGRDYKAIVCLFLYGGSDSMNMVVPASGSNRTNYQNARPDIQLYDFEVASMPGFNDETGQPLTLNGAMPNLAQMMLAGQATTVVNVGTLLEPTNKDNYSSVKRSPNIGAHNKQQLAWQRSWSTSAYHPYGWAGMMMDILASGNETVSPTLSLSGNEWLNGASGSELQLSSEGIRAMSPLSVNSVNNNLTKLLDNNTASMFGRAYLDKFHQIYDFQSTLTNILDLYPEDPDIPAGYLGGQFKMVKRMIEASQDLNQARQVYFVSLGGFDNHSNQRGKHDGLLGQIDTVVSAFYASLEKSGLTDNVVTFTMSDFGRTIENNSNRGTDHGWGSNQIVVGGAVKGGKAYGRYPEFIKDGPDAIGNKFIPTIASEQYAATLCSWFGVSDDGIKVIFPILDQERENKFDSPYLSFLQQTGEIPLVIDSVAASTTRQDHTPEMAIDGDPSTKWTAKGTGITFDITLAQTTSLTQILFSQAKGNVRQYYVQISLSEDGINYNHVHDVLTPGDTLDLVSYDLSGKQAKYIRLTCNGNNDAVNTHLRTWNNFQEIEVRGLI
ncbi:DUF1501 domain-containing protein [Vibrio agarivorans]|uniref:DUF1501 domain-containing protein n=1 Tax=Vibrio agarivorans TaxID=153622 RepID=UPI00222E90CA|nr:DUF1501 domain-containing protein [Vibrio agarivorans]